MICQSIIIEVPLPDQSRMIEESEEENPSVSEIDFSQNPVSEKADDFNFLEVINNALRDYEDVNEEVEIIEDKDNPFQYLNHTYMHNSHRTLVPIGANFQAVVPPMMTIQAYRLKTADMMKTLAILKINDPQEGEAFYNKYFSLIDTRFGPERTYEDVNHLRNAFQRMNSQLSFEEYLAKNSKYWESYFKAKDRAMGPKVVGKKKKKKGTIPI